VKGSQEDDFQNDNEWQRVNEYIRIVGEKSISIIVDCQEARVCIVCFIIQGVKKGTHILCKVRILIQLGLEKITLHIHKIVDVTQEYP
jgi:hypothetical protein